MIGYPYIRIGGLSLIYLPYLTICRFRNNLYNRLFEEINSQLENTYEIQGACKGGYGSNFRGIRGKGIKMSMKGKNLRVRGLCKDLVSYMIYLTISIYRI